MKTVKERATKTLEIKKSKFIAIVQRVDTVEEIENSLKMARITYPFAKHYVYAYILDGKKKCFDDAEPSKTAGAPILHVLEQKNLEHILCIVVRYFGGILLGAGGLVRAYTKSITDVLKDVEMVPLVFYHKYKATFSYEHVKKMDYLLRDKTILEKSFKEKITYLFLLEEKQFLQELKPYAFLEEV